MRKKDKEILHHEIVKLTFENFGLKLENMSLKDKLKESKRPDHNKESFKNDDYDEYNVFNDSPLNEYHVNYFKNGNLIKTLRISYKELAELLWEIKNGR